MTLQHHIQHPLALERELILPQPPYPLVRVDRHGPRGSAPAPARIFMNVDLPQPFAPISPSDSAAEFHGDVAKRAWPELHSDTGGDDH